MSTRVLPKPYRIKFPSVGETGIGYLSIAEFGQQEQIPFDVKRIFWTYHTPERIVRGQHAHYQTQEVLIAVSGRVLVTTELPSGEIETFSMESPNEGLYIPPDAWKTLQYSHNAVQLVLCSTHYDENDYVRDLEQFRNNYQPKS